MTSPEQGCLTLLQYDRCVRPPLLRADRPASSFNRTGRPLFVLCLVTDTGLGQVRANASSSPPMTARRHWRPCAAILRKDRGKEMDFIENRTIDEIEIGDQAEIERVLTRQDIMLFAAASADINQAHVTEPAQGGEGDGSNEAGREDQDADDESLEQGIVHGMWAGTLISALLATKLPGPGTVHLGQTLTFHKPVSVGDKVVIRVRVTAVDKASAQVRLDCVCLDGADETVVSGVAEVRAPTRKIRRRVARMPASGSRPMACGSRNWSSAPARLIRC
jgi:acyl dehydratase